MPTGASDIGRTLCAGATKQREIYRQLGDIGTAADHIAAGAAGLLVTGKYQEAAQDGSARISGTR